MILQTANIVGGFILGASKLKEFGAKEHIEKGEGHLAPFRTTIGVAILVLGVLGLIQRMGILYFGIPWFGASYPQAIPAILMGLILVPHLTSRFAPVHQFVEKLRPFEGWLGVYGILTGVISIFFGCIFCGYGMMY